MAKKLFKIYLLKNRELRYFFINKCKLATVISIKSAAFGTL